MSLLCKLAWSVALATLSIALSSDLSREMEEDIKGSDNMFDYFNDSNEFGE